MSVKYHESVLKPTDPTSAIVGVTSATAVTQNIERTGLIFMNISDNYISLGLGTAAILYSGITLKPGGVWEMDESSLTLAAIAAIASAANSTLSIQGFTGESIRYLA